MYPSKRESSAVSVVAAAGAAAADDQGPPGKSQKTKTLFYLNDDLWADIASDLSVKGIGRLACVCQAIDRQTIVEEGARRALEKRFAGAPHLRACVPRRAGERWLKLLREVEQLSLPLQFNTNRKGPGVETDLHKFRATCNEFGHMAAVVAGMPMRAGRHYAEFTLVDTGWPGTERDQDGLEEVSGTGMGVVGPAFNPMAAGRWGPAWGTSAKSSEQGWMFQICDDGESQDSRLCHNDRYLRWPGMPEFSSRQLSEGSVIGLLLDVDKGSLAVYHNGTRCGLMMQRGGRFKDRDGAVPADLVAPLWWAVDVGYSSSIRVTRKPPPIVTAQDLDADERKARKLLQKQSSYSRYDY